MWLYTLIHTNKLIIKYFAHIVLIMIVPYNHAKMIIHNKLSQCYILNQHFALSIMKTELRDLTNICGGSCERKIAGGRK